MGPVTVTCFRSPFRPKIKASTVPSPPSAKGNTETQASGSARRIPSRTASPASVEVRLPLKESIAITIFIYHSPRFLTPPPAAPSLLPAPPPPARQYTSAAADTGIDIHEFPHDQSGYHRTDSLTRHHQDIGCHFDADSKSENRAAHQQG